MHELVANIYTLADFTFRPRPKRPKQLLEHFMPAPKPDKDHVWISLHDFIILDPRNQEAEDFLNLLEAEFDLPYTLTWRGAEGRKLRLYKVPLGLFGRPSFTCSKMNLDLEVKTGPGEFYLIPEFQGEEHRDKWLLHRSPLDLEPAVLPKVTYMVLLFLANIEKAMGAWQTIAVPVLNELGL